METITKSPTKRRALAALDANALASPKPPHQLKSTAKSPVKQIKRPLEEPMAAAAMSPLPKKRACFETSVPLANLQKMPLPPRAKRAETSDSTSHEKERNASAQGGKNDDARQQQPRAWGKISHSQKMPSEQNLGEDSSDNDEERDEEGQEGEDAAPELPRLSPSKYAMSALQSTEGTLTDLADGLLSLSRSNSDV
ncbi:unnamed protein product [Clonostachys rosea f. rosea IK726]|uniref:Uncharacterized protein n=1 Tax=Clonostachys rosea f. rosea IK726 TaxID=1349383 RepID=A0ACA9T9C7_BIOOC|nr:unnamed protein product [Clonostachys rosea f. rosea IK726]